MRKVINEHNYTVYQCYEQPPIEDITYSVKISFTGMVEVVDQGEVWLQYNCFNPLLWITFKDCSSLRRFYSSLTSTAQIRKLSVLPVTDFAEYHVLDSQTGNMKIIGEPSQKDVVGILEYWPYGKNDKAFPYYISMKIDKGANIFRLVEEEEMCYDSYRYAIYKANLYSISESLHVVKDVAPGLHLELIEEYPNTYGKYWREVDAKEPFIDKLRDKLLTDQLKREEEYKLNHEKWAKKAMTNTSHDDDDDDIYDLFHKFTRYNTDNDDIVI